MPWNMHEPRQGEYCFEGMADVEKFVRLAGDLGLHVIVRPSPYICAEWEFGGLPSWSAMDDHLRLRCTDSAFLAHVDRYYDVLLPRLKPLLSTSNGPIIALQIENEYGAFGNDASYLQYLRDGMVRRGMDVLLFTSDGPTDHMLQAGSVAGHLATVNFGSGTEWAFAKVCVNIKPRNHSCVWNFGMAGSITGASHIIPEKQEMWRRCWRKCWRRARR